MVCGNDSDDYHLTRCDVLGELAVHIHVLWGIGTIQKQQIDVCIGLEWVGLVEHFPHIGIGFDVVRGRETVVGVAIVGPNDTLF